MKYLSSVCIASALRAKCALLLAAAASVFVAPGASAAGYPERSVKLVVAAAPSGGADGTARAVQEPLSRALGQSVVIENRAGASGIIGVDVAAKAPADGYTLLLVTSTHATLPALMSNLPFDMNASFTPITIINKMPEILVVSASLPVRTVKELVEYVRARPEEVGFASGGIGTAPHLGGELLNMVANVRMKHVPYKGTGGLWIDLLSGRVPVAFLGPLAVAPYVKSGQLRALAIADPKRLDVFPGVPTIAEAGYPGAEVSAWYGLAAPAGTPRPVIDALYAATKQAVQSGNVKAQFAKDGVDVVLNTPDEFKAMMASEVERYKALMKAAGIKPE